MEYLSFNFLPFWNLFFTDWHAQKGDTWCFKISRDPFLISSLKEHSTWKEAKDFALCNQNDEKKKKSSLNSTPLFPPPEHMQACHTYFLSIDTSMNSKRTLYFLLLLSIVLTLNVFKSLPTPIFFTPLQASKRLDFLLVDWSLGTFSLDSKLFSCHWKPILVTDDSALLLRTEVAKKEMTLPSFFNCQ